MYDQDYAISIATIHHLSTHGRRKIAVQVSELHAEQSRMALIRRLFSHSDYYNLYRHRTVVLSSMSGLLNKTNSQNAAFHPRTPVPTKARESRDRTSLCPGCSHPKLPKD